MARFHFMVLGWCAAGLGAMVWADPTPPLVERVTNGINGQPPTLGSSRPWMDATGLLVAFDSFASNLADCPGTFSKVYVHSRATLETNCIDRDLNGLPASGFGLRATLSADGTLICYESQASTLMEGDTNGVADIYVDDLVTGVRRRVSLATSGAEPDAACTNPIISGDGRFVFFQSMATNLAENIPEGTWQIYVHEIETGRTDLLTRGYDGLPGNANSFDPYPSKDGMTVGFESRATNLHPDDTNDFFDVYAADRRAGEMRWISRGPGGIPPNDESFYARPTADGAEIVFNSEAWNLVPGDNNFATDVFIYDMGSGDIERINITEFGIESNGVSFWGHLSGDGRYCVFSSGGFTLVPDDTNFSFDVFVKDRQTGVVRRVSVASDGTEAELGSGVSNPPMFSDDGRFILFESAANNLIPNDGNIWVDIFIVDLGAEVSCIGDANRDGRVDFIDYTTVLLNWGTPAGDPVLGDANGDRFVDFRDLTAIMGRWGSSCGR